MVSHAVWKTWPSGLSNNKNLGLRPRFLSAESLGPCFWHGMGDHDQILHHASLPRQPGMKQAVLSIFLVGRLRSLISLCWIYANYMKNSPGHLCQWQHHMPKSNYTAQRGTYQSNTITLILAILDKGIICLIIQWQIWERWHLMQDRITSNFICPMGQVTLKVKVKP